MPEEPGSPGAATTERIVLEVSAPIGNLAETDSGLNYTVRKLESINALLAEAKASYAALTAISSGTAFHLPTVQGPAATPAAASKPRGSTSTSTPIRVDPQQVLMTLPAGTPE